MEPCNEPDRCRDTCIRLANLYCNINNIRVRSFILTGAPRQPFTTNRETASSRERAAK